MMKRILSLVLCLLLMAGMAGLAEEAAQANYTTGTPWMDPEVLGNVTEDTPADLKDNFALYVNKDKILAAEMPAGMPMAGPMVDAHLQSIYDMLGMYMQEVPRGMTRSWPITCSGC